MSFETEKEAARQWTILLGENGAGKSTILRSIALVLAGSKGLTEVIGDHDSWIRSGAADAEIEVQLSTARKDRRTVRIGFRRGASTIDFIDANRVALEELDRALAHAERNYFVVGYGVNRRAQAEGGQQFVVPNPVFNRQSRSQNFLSLFTPGAPLVSLEQWVIDLDYREGEAGIEVVRTAFDKLLPDVRFAGIDKRNRRLRFDTPDGILPLELLSDGYQAMAAWCGDLLFRITETFSNYKDALSARGLLLIDEVDLHLHPVWQRHLLEFLGSTLPNFQFVITTHSPITAQQAGEGELFILGRDGPGGAARLRQFEGAPNRLRLPQLIQSPLFGLETLDSPQVAEARDEVRALKGLPTEGSRYGKPIELPATEAARTRRLRQRERELDRLPREMPEHAERTNKLLERVAAELTDDRTHSGRTAVRAVVRRALASSSKQASNRK